jgi:hypothetical protein
MFSKRIYFTLFIMLIAFNLNLAAQDCSECYGVYQGCQSNVSQCSIDCIYDPSLSSCNYLSYMLSWSCLTETVRSRITYYLPEI